MNAQCALGGMAANPIPIFDGGRRYPTGKRPFFRHFWPRERRHEHGSDGSARRVRSSRSHVARASGVVARNRRRVATHSSCARIFFNVRGTVCARSGSAALHPIAIRCRKTSWHSLCYDVGGSGSDNRKGHDHAKTWNVQVACPVHGGHRGDLGGVLLALGCREAGLAASVVAGSEQLADARLLARGAASHGAPRAAHVRLSATISHGDSPRARLRRDAACSRP
jgi:hypothetical protein